MFSFKKSKKIWKKMKKISPKKIYIKMIMIHKKLQDRNNSNIYKKEKIANFMKIIFFWF